MNLISLTPKLAVSRTFNAAFHAPHSPPNRVQRTMSSFAQRLRAIFSRGDFAPGWPSLKTPPSSAKNLTMDVGDQRTIRWLPRTKRNKPPPTLTLNSTISNRFRSWAQKSRDVLGFCATQKSIEPTMVRTAYTRFPSPPGVSSQILAIICGSLTLWHLVLFLLLKYRGIEASGSFARAILHWRTDGR